MKVVIKADLAKVLTKILISGLVFGVMPEALTGIIKSQEAIAATKSLVAPTEALSEPSPKLNPESAPLSTPSPGLESNLLESGSEAATNQVFVKESQKTEAQPRPEILIESANKPNQVTSKENSSADPKLETSVILESRASGCRADDRQLGTVQANLCDSPPMVKPQAPTYTQPSSYGSYSFSGIRATVRPLDRSAWARANWTKVNLPFNLAINLPINLPRNLGDRAMTFPLSIPAEISSSFGYRIHPISGVERFHQGTDIAAAEGTPVLAAFSGKVEISGWMGGLGLAVIISHDSDRETRYGHLSLTFVQPGQWVEQGTVIGFVGSTGMSTGPHLHFELWQQQLGEWVATDPAPYLTLALVQLNRFIAQQSKLNPA